MPVQCTCRICGAAFARPPSLVGPYCSRRCASDAKQTAVARPCLHCGHAFMARPSALASGGGKYCSPPCFRQRNGSYVWFACLHCGTRFERKPSYARHGWGQYCSRACKDEAKTVRTATAAWFWRRVERSDGCWVWQGATAADGYGCLIRAGRSLLAHRYSYALTFGPIPDGLFVCHHCDNRPCVRPEHLYLGTVQDNSRDAVERGRLPRGEAHRNARLTEQIIREIRARHAGGTATTNALAREYGLYSGHVSDILHRRLWKHVT